MSGLDYYILGGVACTDAPSEGATAAYGPVVDALRSRLRAEPEALAGCGPLLPHLALLLPELGEPAAESDRATIFEAVRSASDAPPWSSYRFAGRL